MERPLLEGAQLRPLGIAPRPLRENEDALLKRVHLLRRALERLERALGVPAVDEDSAGERHEPAQERHPLEALLRRDGAPGREDAAEKEDVELGLVVANDDERTGGEEVLFAGEDDEFDAGGPAHGVVEGAGSEVLA